MTPMDLAEPRMDLDETTRMRHRLERLEALVRAIEAELADDTLTAEQRLMHIGERVAAFTDGR